MHQRQPSSESKKANIDDQMRYLKWMEVIRTDDIEAAQQLAPSSKISPLILVAQFGTTRMLKLLAPQYDINHQEVGLGNTALHYACKGNRLAMVECIYESCPGVNDVLLNSDGQDCRDIARSQQVVDIIQKYRLKFTTKILTDVAALIQKSEADVVNKLNELYLLERVRKLVDLNQEVDSSGSTLLHLAAEQSQELVVSFLLKHQADPLSRDRKGRLPSDRTKDDKIKLMFKGVLAQTSFTTIQSPQAPTQKVMGTLYKWTNYAGGYKKRYFVLQDGQLSYYRSQTDYPVNCRGSVALNISKLHVDNVDKTRFDIILGSSSQQAYESGKNIATTHHERLHSQGLTRWYLKAEHQVEAKRWLIALAESKQHVQEDGRIGKRAPRKSSAEEDGSQSGSQTSFTNRKGARHMIPSYSLATMTQASYYDEEIGDDQDSYAQTREKEKVADSEFEDHVQATIYSALAGLQYQQQVLQGASSKTQPAEDVIRNATQVSQLLKKSGDTIQETLQNLLKSFEDRERLWHRRLEREENLKRVWEENLKVLAAQHDEMAVNAQKTVAALERKVTSAKSPASQQSADEEEFFDAVEGESPMTQSASLELAPGYKSVYRKNLPSLGQKPPEISLWSILKNNIGKDLSKIALPVFFNEPLSMLQRLCEEMEYSNLLDVASSRVNSQPDGLDTGRFERILFVGAFAMSNYSSTQGRTGKPFNPLLGETFEYVRHDRGFKYIAEQVSHHPPIGACHCESENYEFWSQAFLKNKFWGKSLEILPQGTCHVILKSTNEHYSWKKVTTCVNNLIVGKLWIDHYGDMVITNHTTGDECLVRFKQSGWRGEKFLLEGHVKSLSGTVVYELSGKWDEKLVCKQVASQSVIDTLLQECSNPFVKSTSTANATSLVRKMSMLKSPQSDGGQSCIVWKRNPVSADAEKQYFLTDFAITLNELTPELKEHLPPTDSRLRPDQRAMENAQFELADQEKSRLEDEQRQRRKERQIAEGPSAEYQPQWFYRDGDKDSGEDHWIYKKNYWQARESRSWQTLDLFK